MSLKKSKEIFSQNIRHYLFLNNKKQIDLVNDLGFNSSTVSNWCNGVMIPRIDTLKKIADYLNISMQQLLDEPNSIEANPDKEIKGVAYEMMHLICKKLENIDSLETLSDKEVSFFYARIGHILRQMDDLISNYILARDNFIPHSTNDPDMNRQFEIYYYQNKLSDQLNYMNNVIDTIPTYLIDLEILKKSPKDY